jgi:glutamate-ammonia-ligase adenylyltransferase
MVDIEFAVQFLVLSQGCRHPELLANAGNIALLQRAQACRLLDAPVGENAAQAYRTLRQMQHRARLNEEPTQVDQADIAAERAAGLALWAGVFETAVLAA